MAPLNSFVVSLLFLVCGTGCTTLSKSKGFAEVLKLEQFTNLTSLVGEVPGSPAGDGRTNTFRFVRAGNPESWKKVLLIHGYPDSLFTWRNLLLDESNMGKRAREHFEFYALDLPGHGYTETVPMIQKTQFEPEAAAKGVVAFMDAVRVHEAILVGNSFGGLVAAYLAKKHPERVAGLVLLDSEGGTRTWDEYMRSERMLRTPPFSWFSGSYTLGTIGNAVLNPIDSLRYGSSWEAAAAHELRILVHDRSRITDDLRRSYEILMRTRGNYRTNRYLVQRSHEADERLLAEIGLNMRSRTIIIWGCNDRLFAPDRQAEKFRSWFDVPVHFCQAGHLPQLERPEFVLERLLEAF